ncbi:unnamed protein product [[Candida] boidinii]|uniref:Unnamed protein product n=1 Tax=Candida boidinii TaxID=5477 RepID=A0A9W6WF15_CANBO|nr:hypothetical protein BVG19_g4650 [[Candida] boidinii]OWB50086.1 hypothetical protein B5S27_g1633 [[Candida] boidinii]OWB64825.1 hypothetical protein B5S30_g146 [[Candida] boidinii]OWB81523.1 hypothetical protein B5S33_g140 [[Candida] boidinii]GME68787.1 unnamed protein product [[Candida] boidinii]
MGSFASKLFASKSREIRMLMLGLDNAGKTTILYKLKLGKTKQTVPTVGFNVETIKYKNMTMHTWDIGGQERIRALWRHYFSGTDALIFVVDAADRDRLDNAKKELYKVINDKELKNCLLAVLANKQDLPNALKPKELIQELELENIHDHNWCVIPTVATNGVGLTEVLSWISNNTPN